MGELKLAHLGLVSFYFFVAGLTKGFLVTIPIDLRWPLVRLCAEDVPVTDPVFAVKTVALLVLSLAGSAPLFALSVIIRLPLRKSLELDSSYQLRMPSPNPPFICSARSLTLRSK